MAEETERKIARIQRFLQGEDEEPPGYKREDSLGQIFRDLGEILDSMVQDNSDSDSGSDSESDTNTEDEDEEPLDFLEGAVIPSP